RRARRGRGGARPADAEAARRGSPPRLRGEDGPRRRRAGGAEDVRVRRGGRGDPGREADPRPAGARRAGGRVRRALSVLAARGFLRALRRPRRGRRAAPARVLMAERLRLWLERSRDGEGFFLRDAASGEPVPFADPRIRVVHVAGVSFRAEALQDEAFEPG